MDHHRYLIILLLAYMHAGDGAPTEIDISLRSDDQPPLIFPEDGVRYKIIPNNSSIIKTLTHSTPNTSDEIYQMLHSRHSKDPTIISNNGRSPETENENNANPKLQSELLDREGAIVDKDEPRGKSSDDETGKWGAIIAAVVLAIAAAGYLAMVLWRRSLEKKYGSRQVLVNEDDVTVNSFKDPVVI